MVTVLGPRFRPADLVVLTRTTEGVRERRIARVRVPVYAGHGGWLAVPPAVEAGPGAIRVERWVAPALVGHVLAHLDLGMDAASTHDPALPSRPWVAPLLRAYRGAPGHLRVQVLGLAQREPDALIRELRFDPPMGLGDPAGRRLCGALADALESEEPGFRATWDPRAPALPAVVVERLARLRAQLWSARGRGAPPLRVLDVPALGGSGRATVVGGERRVAVSLGEPTEHVLCQILHEEVHEITDPLVLGERREAARDTRRDGPGWSLHAELESTAVQATEALLGAISPELLPAFHRWQARTGALTTS